MPDEDYPTIDDPFLIYMFIFIYIYIHIHLKLHSYHTYVLFIFCPMFSVFNDISFLSYGVLKWLEFILETEI